MNAPASAWPVWTLLIQPAGLSPKAKGVDRVDATRRRPARSLRGSRQRSSPPECDRQRSRRRRPEPRSAHGQTPQVHCSVRGATFLRSARYSHAWVSHRGRASSSHGDRMSGSVTTASWGAGEASQPVAGMATVCPICRHSFGRLARAADLQPRCPRNSSVSPLQNDHARTEPTTRSRVCRTLQTAPRRQAG